MTDELLFKYFDNRATEVEKKKIEQWLDADPSHQKEFDAAHVLFNAMVLKGDAVMKKDLRADVEKPRRAAFWRRPLWRGVAVAACLALVAVLGYEGKEQADHVKEVLAQVNTLEVPAGQRLTLTLNDGTRVSLNGNSRIEYPVVFAKDVRRVKISGEAFLEVAHDASHPFQVETFASVVEVLGTKFNIYADETAGHFSTTLLEGKVKVVTKPDHNNQYEQVVLSPDEMVSLVDNHLIVADVDADDSISWRNGYINLKGLSFDGLMKRFENTYGVRIVMMRDDIPDIGYLSGKIRISEGVNFALKLLQKGCDFNYEEDYETNTITIY